MEGPSGSRHGCPVRVSVPLERALIWISDLWFGFEQVVEASAVHQVGADEAGERQRALHGFLGGLREAEQQEGDQRHGDLDAHGIL